MHPIKYIWMERKELGNQTTRETFRGTTDHLLEKDFQAQYDLLFFAVGVRVFTGSAFACKSE